MFLALPFLPPCRNGREILGSPGLRVPRSLFLRRVLLWGSSRTREGEEVGKWVLLRQREGYEYFMKQLQLLNNITKPGMLAGTGDAHLHGGK